MESKRARAIVYFFLAYSLGFLTHWGLFKFKNQNFSLSENREQLENSDRVPVHPEDLKGEDLLDALHRDMLERMGKRADDFPGRDQMINPHDDFSHSDSEIDSYGLKDFLVQDINRREDDKFVYYELPLLNEKGEKIELKVEVKNGIIEIVEKSVGANHQSESSRSFSIEPGLKEDRAQVINEKDKIVIKIPKK